MATLEEALQKTPPKILGYGPPGNWKTSFYATWGSVSEIIDLDGKLLPLWKLNDQFTAERKAVYVTPCYDRNPQVPSAFEAFKARVFQIADLCVNNKYDKKILIVDSLTSAGEHAMRKILGPSAINRPMPVNVTQAQWGLAINELENMLTVLKSLPICVIVIAHELTEVVDEITKTKIWALGAKLPNKLPVGFHEIWYHRMVGGGADRHAALQTLASNVTATTRGGLPDNFDVRKGLREALKIIGYEP